MNISTIIVLSGIVSLIAGLFLFCISLEQAFYGKTSSIIPIFLISIVLIVLGGLSVKYIQN